jgi:tRNA A-37 threonylcarbamoyl transferase component Bud32
MTDIREQLQQTLTGSYTLERELGGGGMSRVFVAEDQRLKRKVVVKVLSPELAAGLSAERFEREIQMAASLQQANIVPLLSAGDANGVPYYTMPLVEGQSLRTRLATGPLAVTETVSILKDVARALSYAHERGVVHRDIKPDNVLLSGGAAVVTDFGIAKALSAARTDSGGATLTQLGTAIGTPAYMAPEQAAGDPEIDYRADIYSFGCMAYELLTGRAPFHGRTPQRMMAAHMSEMPPHVSGFRPDTPMALAELVTKCLAKDASARPQQVSEVIRVLDSVTSGGGLPAMPPILLGGPGMMKKALAAYVAAFVIVAIFARAAIVAIGLPDWVFPGALVVMALGLPVILFTGYVHHVNRRIATTTPTFTPGGTPSMPQGTMATLAVKATPHVTWRRATMGGVYALGAFAFLVGGWMVLRALGIGPAGSLLAAGKLSDQAQLLIASFKVSGADTTLGHIIEEALRTDLSQSSAITAVPPGAVATALRRMRRPETTTVNLQLAREIALRDGIEAVLDGDITPLAGGFIITMRLVTGESGVELARFRATADSPKDLLATVDKLSRQLRGKVGESLRGVNATPPLEHVTTPSLDALRKYVQGTRALAFENDNVKAIGFLQEAVALDTAFAMAYRRLGVSYGNAGFPREKQDTALSRAYRFRDRLTDAERYLTEATYYESGPFRNRERAVRAYEALLEVAPKDLAGLNNLGNRYRSRREHARAEGLYRRAVDGGGAPVITYNQLVVALFDQGKIAEARRLADSIRALFPGATGDLGREIAFLIHEGKLDSIARLNQARRAARNAQDRAGAAFRAANLSQLRGRLADWERAQAEARSINVGRGIPAPPLNDSVTSVRSDAWYREQPERAVRRMDALLARTPLRSVAAIEQRPYFAVANVYAYAGRADKARAILAQYDADIRDSTIRNVRAPDYHYVQSQIALAERRYADAIVEVRASDNLPDGPANDCAICLYAELGRAYDAASQPDSAITYFERYFATPYWNRGAPFADPLYSAGLHKRLGELYEAKADRQRAVQHYMKFVELWKDSDPDLRPRVDDVRRRIARLIDPEKR